MSTIRKPTRKATKKTSKRKARKSSKRTKKTVDPEAKAAAEKLGERIRKTLSRRRGIDELRMFGGLCFTVNGNMAVGVTGEGDLMVRVGPEGYEDALDQKGARPMDFTGRPMKGFVFVDPTGHRGAAALKKWVERGLAFARSLPAKK